jgi:hypothetical protein
MVVIACAVRIKTTKESRTGKAAPGLPADFRFRFPNIEKTTSVSQAEFIAWLEQQCASNNVTFTDRSVLELIHQQCLGVAGQALRPLRRARFRGETLTREFVSAFRWDAE